MSTYSYTSSNAQSQRSTLGPRGIEAEYAAAAAYGEPALSDAASDAQIARAIAESKTSRAMGYASNSSSASTLLGSAAGSGSDSGSSTPGSRAASLYSYGSGSNSNYSYGGALPQRHIPTPAYPGHSPVPTPAHSASRVPLPSSAYSATSSSTPRQLQSPYAGSRGPPTPTPRYAADELLARNLAREWRVASVQGQVLADPQFARSAPSTPAPAPRNVHFTPPGSSRSAHGGAGPPPLVVRAPSPTPSVASVASARSNWSYHAPSPHRASTSSHHASRPPSIAHSRSQSAGAPNASARGTPTPSRPLSPLDVDDDFYLRTPSVRSAASSTSSSSAASIRSMSSAASTRSSASGASARSGASIRSASSKTSMRSGASASTAHSHRSTQSLLASLTRAARHAPLHAAAAQARELHRASSRASSRNASVAGSSRAHSVRSGTSSTGGAHSGAEASGLTLEERTALARLHALATAPARCTNPACGAMIPGVLRGVWDGILFPTPPSVDPTPPKPFPLSPSSSSSSTSPKPLAPMTPIPIPQSLTAALHASCPACSATHCRGCGLAVACSGGPACGVPPPKSMSRAGYNANPNPNPRTTHWHCPLPTHCAPARALGAVAALCAFDRAHLLVSTTASPGREADKALLGPLHALLYFLAPPPPIGVLGPMTPRASRDVPGGLLFSVPEDGGEHDGWGAGGGEEGGGETETEMEAEMDPALPALLLLSRAPGYVAGLLRAGVPYTTTSGYGYGGGGGAIASAMPNVDVGTWMARAPAYGAVLRLLRAVGDAGGGGRRVLARPVVALPPLRTGKESGGEVERWLRSARGETSSTRHRDNNNNREGGGETLLTLIRRLEPARAALLRLAGATSFGPTVEKAHALCDGVLYVLLQDVLGEGEGEI
ncbi:hypothetical protein C8F04DRAFT_1336064 [Mycena alexandri]|uniref:Uncharacterized protein n=1 Tax=Mycena alexandri TaxID=1745969 RepID=A0AAD6T2G7_9AGAR|nr:hypothetical protein C8F04DRAFT_1336064 [Mycena alexandri]